MWKRALRALDVGVEAGVSPQCRVPLQVRCGCCSSCLLEAYSGNFQCQGLLEAYSGNSQCQEECLLILSWAPANIKP